MKLKDLKLPENNLVAKHAGKFNRAVTMRDKKKDYSRKAKHKGASVDDTDVQ